jgi:hypothetical protein
MRYCAGERWLRRTLEGSFGVLADAQLHVLSAGSQNQAAGRHPIRHAPIQPADVLGDSDGMLAWTAAGHHACSITNEL